MVRPLCIHYKDYFDLQYRISVLLNKKRAPWEPSFLAFLKRITRRRPQRRPHHGGRRRRHAHRSGACRPGGAVAAGLKPPRPASPVAGSRLSSPGIGSVERNRLLTGGCAQGNGISSVHGLFARGDVDPELMWAHLDALDGLTAFAGHIASALDEPPDVARLRRDAVGGWHAAMSALSQSGRTLRDHQTVER